MLRVVPRLHGPAALGAAALFTAALVLFYAWRTGILGPETGRAAAPDDADGDLLRTTSGERVRELFARYDAAAGFPRIDLVVPLDPGALPLLHPLAASADLFWPHKAGRKILLVDGNAPPLGPLTPPGWDVEEVRYPPGLDGVGGWLRSQWVAANADVLSRSGAEFLAFLDADSPLALKVTPDLLFDAAGRVRVIGNYAWQQRLWAPSFRFYLNDSAGTMAPYINSMVFLPQVFPRAMLPAAREFYSSLHAGRPDVAELMKRWSATTRDPHMSFFALFAHFALASPRWKDRFFLVDENRDAPVLRSAAHLPYQSCYLRRLAPGFASAVIIAGVRHKRYDYAAYYAAARELLLSGACASVPAGSVPACARVEAPDVEDARNFWWEYSAENWWPNATAAGGGFRGAWDAHFAPLHAKLRELMGP